MRPSKVMCTAYLKKKILLYRLRLDLQTPGWMPSEQLGETKTLIALLQLLLCSMKIGKLERNGQSKAESL